MPAPALMHSLMIVFPLLATGLALWMGGWLRHVFVWSTRLLLAVLMIGGGLYKLSDNHIHGLMGPPMDHAFLAKNGLEIFAQFIGVAQLVIGLLLLTGRFALLGAMMLVPMWVGIIMLTWSQHWVGTPYLTTGFLVLNLGLLLHDYQRLKFILYPAVSTQDLRSHQLRTGPWPLELLWWLGVLIVVVGSLLYEVSFQLMQYTMLVGVGLVGGAGVGLWRHRQATSVVTEATGADAPPQR